MTRQEIEQRIKDILTTLEALEKELAAMDEAVEDEKNAEEEVEHELDLGEIPGSPFFNFWEAANRVKMAGSVPLVPFLPLPGGERYGQWVRDPQTGFFWNVALQDTLRTAWVEGRSIRLRKWTGAYADRVCGYAARAGEIFATQFAVIPEGFEPDAEYAQFVYDNWVRAAGTMPIYGFRSGYMNAPVYAYGGERIAGVKMPFAGNKLGDEENIDAFRRACKAFEVSWNKPGTAGLHAGNMSFKAGTARLRLLKESHQVLKRLDREWTRLGTAEREDFLQRFEPYEPEV